MTLDSEKILKLWASFNKAPLGKELFTRALGFMAPYSGSIGAKVLKIEPGFCEVELNEHRAVRNHLKSVHAVALMNLGEMSTGLACLTSLPPKSRAILKALKIEYHKKARGRLVAKCQTPQLEQIEKMDITIKGNIYDENNVLVSSVEALWRVDKEK